MLPPSGERGSAGSDNGELGKEGGGLAGIGPGGARGGDSGGDNDSAVGASGRSLSTQYTEQKTCGLAGGGCRRASTSRSSPSGGC